MKFTTDIPTTPGEYAWRANEHLEHEVFRLVIREGKLKQRVAHTGEASDLMNFGEWCRLVPHDEVVPKEEVEKAWDEAMDACDSTWVGEIKPSSAWPNSRAKRVMEGNE